MSTPVAGHYIFPVVPGGKKALRDAAEVTTFYKRSFDRVPGGPFPLVTRGAAMLVAVSDARLAGTYVEPPATRSGLLAFAHSATVAAAAFAASASSASAITSPPALNQAAVSVERCLVASIAGAKTALAFFAAFGVAANDTADTLMRDIITHRRKCSALLLKAGSLEPGRPERTARAAARTLDAAVEELLRFGDDVRCFSPFSSLFPLTLLCWTGSSSSGDVLGIECIPPVFLSSLHAPRSAWFWTCAPPLARTRPPPTTAPPAARPSSSRTTSSTSAARAAAPLPTTRR